ncbi:MAG TPA: AMP-dependent synthetase [Chloroflexi bacterium]|nr:AMP-dependent synthetase [Chloroflexota bacterium]
MLESYQFSDEIVWKPTKTIIENSNLYKFMREHKIDSYDDLMDKSTTDISWFTEAILQYLNIEFQKPYKQILDVSNGIQIPKWCTDGDLNITHNCIDKWINDKTISSTPAIIWESESNQSIIITYEQLAQKVHQCANSLKLLGYRKGDIIAICMPMIPETAIALLSIIRIGAIALPLFSGYGSTAIANRLNHTKAKGIITADGFIRKGKLTQLKHTVDQALINTPAIQNVLVVQTSQNNIEMETGRDHWWHNIVPYQSTQCNITPTSAEDPIMIIYTSGTTGNPKGIVHTHCGFPVKAAQDMSFGFDVSSGDVVHWITDIGWMMGPWMILGSTILGASILMYDGAPDYPDINQIWKLTQKHNINVLGLSPTFIRSIMSSNETSVETHDLSSLHSIGSTGEPWNPAPWQWLFETVCKKSIPIINYSGGTEISGGILMGNPLLPIKPGSFPGPCPGIAADVVNENGESIENQVGELIIRAPWIGMSRGFFANNARYIDTYWSRWKNIWAHGDWAEKKSDGHWYILGRSDDTINISGKRLGPAEVESILVSSNQVQEAAAIGIPNYTKGNELICFCVLSQQSQITHKIKDELQSIIIKELGKPLKPHEIFFVPDLPKTRNGKIMRRVIRDAYLQKSTMSYESLVNPHIIEIIKNLRKN